MGEEGKIKVVMLATLTDGDNPIKKDGKEYVVSRAYFDLHSKIMAPVKKSKKK